MSEYMVSVDGKSAPCKVHETFAEAEAEAERLALMPGNRGATIRLLKVFGVLEPAHRWRTISPNQPKAPWHVHPEQADDPCPNCVPGSACRTPSCGRLKLAQANGKP